MLNDTIKNSLLQDHEKEELISLLEKCDEATKNKIVEIAKTRPDIIPELYINFVAKKYALSKNSADVYRSIIESTRNLIDTLDA